MSLHELSVRCAAYLARELEADRIQENRMAFGLELFLGELIKLILVIMISLLLGILPEVLTVTLAAGFLRLASGESTALPTTDVSSAESLVFWSWAG